MEGLHTTHHIAPLLNINHSINPNSKVSGECKNFNPVQQMHFEEFDNGLLHFLSMRVIAGNLKEVLGPELACIFQTISNVSLLVSGRELDLTEDNIATQVADILLQPLLHKLQACQQNFCMMSCGLNNKLFILATIWVHEEVGE